MGLHQPPLFGPCIGAKRQEWIKMPLSTEVGLGPGYIMLDGDPAPPPKKGAQPPIFGRCLLWPNGWIDQDATWYESRRQPRRHCVNWGPSSPQKTDRSPIFGPCLLWPNGWTDQGATWYGDRPRPRRHCVRWGSSSLPHGQGHSSPHFLARVYSGQTVAHLSYC